MNRPHKNLTSLFGPKRRDDWPSKERGAASWSSSSRNVTSHALNGDQKSAFRSASTLKMNMPCIDDILNDDRSLKQAPNATQILFTDDSNGDYVNPAVSFESPRSPMTPPNNSQVTISPRTSDCTPSTISSPEMPDLPPLSSIMALLSMSKAQTPTRQQPYVASFSQPSSIADLRAIALSELQKLKPSRSAKDARLFAINNPISNKRHHLASSDSLPEPNGFAFSRGRSPSASPAPRHIRSSSAYEDGDMDADEGGDKKRKFKCSYEGCSKGFPSRAHLIRHSRVHTGEKPFQCPHESCGKFFSRQDNMLQHFKSHEGKAMSLGERTRPNSASSSAANSPQQSFITERQPVIRFSKVAYDSALE